MVPKKGDIIQHRELLEKKGVVTGSIIVGSEHYYIIKMSPNPSRNGGMYRDYKFLRGEETPGYNAYAIEESAVVIIEEKYELFEAPTKYFKQLI